GDELVEFRRALAQRDILLRRRCFRLAGVLASEQILQPTHAIALALPRPRDTMPKFRDSSIAAAVARRGLRYACTKGRRVVGFPVRTSNAFATAGAITGVPGSPTPLGGLADGTMKVSTRGASFMRRTR